MSRVVRLALVLLALLGSVGVARAADTTVEIGNVTAMSWAFRPSTIQVSAGDTVTWIDRSTADSEPHTVTPDVPGAFPSSPILRPGQRHVVTFATPGEFQYHCDIHPDMLGTVVVFPAAAIPSTPSPAATPTATPASTPVPPATPTPAPASAPPTAAQATAGPATAPPTPTAPSPAASAATTPIPPAPDRGVLPFAAIILAAVLALLLGRRAYRRGR